MDVILECVRCGEEVLLARGAWVDARDFGCPKCNCSKFKIILRAVEEEPEPHIVAPEE